MEIEKEIGKKYGRLTIISLNGRIEYFYKWKTYQYMVNCKCDCGRETVVNLNSIRRGRSTSCGCYNSEYQKIHKRTHGLSSLEDGSKRPEYSIWIGMKKRCYNKNDNHYKDYGGRGIIICDEWKNSFENFYRDLGQRPNKDYSIERINVNGNYEPSNCKWILKSHQAKNIRTNQVEYKGRIQCLKDWCIELNLPYMTIRHRVNDLKMSLEEAIKLPKSSHAKKRSLVDIEANGGTKLNSKSVIEIYNSDLPRKELAAKYNVRRTTIDGIKNKKSWKRVLENL